MTRGNDQYGSLPQGEYSKKTTKMYFCCRADGFSENEIFLPTGKFNCGSINRYENILTIVKTWCCWLVYYQAKSFRSLVVRRVDIYLRLSFCEADESFTPFLDGALIYCRFAPCRCWYSFTFPGRMKRWVTLQWRKRSSIGSISAVLGIKPAT